MLEEIRHKGGVMEKVGGGSTKDEVEVALNKAAATSTPAAEAQNEIGEDALRKSLEEEYGEETVEYTDDDLGGGFITESGIYHGFITGITIQKIKRATATKTKPAGSIFFWLKPVIQATEKVVEGGNMPQGGNVWPSIRYEPGSMLEYEKFCISAKCKAFNTKDGSRKYFPRASYLQCGAVGMPITFTVKMEPRTKMMKSELSGDWIPDLDQDGNEQKQTFAEVLAFAPWDTTKRYEAPDDTPDVEVGEDDF